MTTHSKNHSNRLYYHW